MGKNKKKDDVFQGRKVYELGEEWQNAPVTKEEGKACKHRLEKRWYRRMIELNILMIVIVIGLIAANWKDNLKWGKESVEQIMEGVEISGDDEKYEDAGDGDSEDGQVNDDSKDEDKKDNSEAIKVPFELELLGYGIILLVVGYLALYFMYAQYRTKALRITENNFKEVYDIIDEYSKRLGIKTPKAYVVQQNGVLNAFSAFLFRKQWICIHSEIFEVAYREHKDMKALSFIIAHELAHIYYGHATLGYNLAFWFSRIIPVFSDIASRTREYSCDRLAQRLTGEDGIESMLMLVVDRHLYKMVDKEDFVKEMSEQKGLFVWAANMVADHPILSKRVMALVEGRGSGKVY